MKKLILLSFLIVFYSSCNDFLEENSQNLIYASTADDLNELLIGECYRPGSTPLISSPVTMFIGESKFESYYPWLHVMDDDSEEFVSDFVASDSKTARYMLGSFHRWQKEIFLNGENIPFRDYTWERIYKTIAVLNSVITQADALRGKEDESRLNHIQGEAYFLRALNYFILANIYGEPYAKATASTDLCIPLKTSASVEDKLYSRDACEKVYNQIIEDLKRAQILVGEAKESSVLRVGKDVINALLSRVYLYMEEYTLSIAAAQGALQSSHSVTDLNAYVAGTNFVYRSSPETIFTTVGYELSATFVNDSTSEWNGNDNRVSAFKASGNLMDTYDQKDLRLGAFFYTSAKNKAFLPLKYRTPLVIENSVSDNMLIRLSEVILNKAEAHAMLGQETEAKAELTKLRSKRFRPVDLKPVTETGEALVNFIREERRRELCFEGHRWFDLRRYSVNSKYPLPDSFHIRHPNYRYEGNLNVHFLDGYYELQSYGKDKAAWSIPVPNFVVEFNKGMITNPVRQIRQPIR